MIETETIDYPKIDIKNDPIKTINALRDAFSPVCSDEEELSNCITAAIVYSGVTSLDIELTEERCRHSETFRMLKHYNRDIFYRPGDSRLGIRRVIREKWFNEFLIELSKNNTIIEYLRIHKSLPKTGERESTWAKLMYAFPELDPFACFLIGLAAGVSATYIAVSV